MYNHDEADVEGGFAALRAAFDVRRWVILERFDRQPCRVAAGLDWQRAVRAAQELIGDCAAGRLHRSAENLWRLFAL
jgi:hypothetical protein